MQHVGGLFSQALEHYQSGRVALAVQDCRRLLVLDPGHADACHLLGVIVFKIGQPAGSAVLIGHALVLHPHNPSYFVDIAFPLQSLGRRGEALAAVARALCLQPEFRQAFVVRGELNAALNRTVQAARDWRHATDLAPAEPTAYLELGNVHWGAGRAEDAQSAYLAAVLLHPAYADALNNLGIVQTGRGRLRNASQSLERAIRVSPDVAACDNLAGVFSNLGRMEEAERFSRITLAMNPSFSNAHNNRGTILRSLGRFADAAATFNHAIAINPKDPTYYYNFSTVTKFAGREPILKEVEALAGDDKMDALGRGALYHALSKAAKDAGNEEKSFDLLLQANRLLRSHYDYDEAADLGRMRRSEEIFTSALMASREGWGDPSRTPVFIVGMPRSGTSLVEQILASHPDMFGAGEQTGFASLIDDIQRETGILFPDAVVELPRKRFAKLGRDYVGEMKQLAPPVSRISDKMPSNFRYIGLIHLALPEARIIHCRRDPVDTCLSCFSTLFSGSLPFTYDLTELGRYYRAYARLMAHWRAVLPPGIMIDVDYEEVVEDLEGQARRIVAHCGLVWNDACLDFHRTKRPVRTASASQVRNPIYKNAIGKWRPADDRLQPLLDALETG